VGLGGTQLAPGAASACRELLPSPPAEQAHGQEGMEIYLLVKVKPMERSKVGFFLSIFKIKRSKTKDERS
jgi:hypothetical protein